MHHWLSKIIPLELRELKAGCMNPGSSILNYRVIRCLCPVPASGLAQEGWGLNSRNIVNHATTMQVYGADNPYASGLKTSPIKSYKIRETQFTD